MLSAVKRPNTIELATQPKKRQQTAAHREKTTGIPHQLCQVGRSTVLPSFAELTANIPEPRDESMHSPSEAALRDIRPLQLDAPGPSAQQSSQAPAASSNFHGRMPPVPTHAWACLENIAQKPPSGRRPLPPLQPVGSLPADRLGQTSTPSAPAALISEKSLTRVKFVDLKTGKPASMDTQGAIPASTFRSRKLVDPNTGAAVLTGTPGAITVNAFRKRKLVDPNTGKKVSKETPGAITTTTFRSRKLVDPKTGKPASKDTQGAISADRFLSRRLVNPDTGETVPEGTKGALKASTFKNRRLVDPITGEKASESTKGPIRASTFKSRMLVDPITGEKAGKDTKGAISATAFYQRKPRS
jgi:hypothetical protein